MTDTRQDQLASIAAIADNLDGLLDDLFATAAELKVILARASEGTGK